MKKSTRCIWTVVLIAAAAGVLVLFGLAFRELRTMNRQESEERIRAERARISRMVSAEEKRLEFEDRRIREQRQKNEAEERRLRAVGSLKEYLRREETLLNQTIAESVTASQEILADRQKLSSVLADIERENARASERARTNGWKRYEKAERVMMILKHPGMNELALKYLGEDFSAMKAECRSRIKSVLDMQAETSRRLAENREKYLNAQEGIENDVEKKTDEARTMTLGANKDLEKRLAELVSKRDSRAAMLIQMKKKGAKSKTSMNEIGALQDEIVALEKEIGRVKEVVSVSRANVSHVAATMAETGARRRGDNALSERQDADNAVHAEMAHERTVFNLAVTYEGRSLDAIRSSMRTRADIVNVRMSDAQARLDTIHRASGNVDMMSVEQIEQLKSRIAAAAAEKIIEAGK